MMLWAKQHTMGYKQLPVPCQIQSILLSYGANPNKTTSAFDFMGRRGSLDRFSHIPPTNSYPAHYYYDSSLTECRWQLIHYEYWPTLVTRPSHVLRLLKFMDSACAAEAGKRIIECCHELLGEEMPIEAFEETQNLVWQVFHEALTLLSLSQLAVWKAIGRNFHAAETTCKKRLKMIIPGKTLQDLDNMFVCHCHN